MAPGIVGWDLGRSGLHRRQGAGSAGDSSGFVGYPVEGCHSDVQV